jgi:tRNA (guanine37-N1)-methyltransferase
VKFTVISVFPQMVEQALQWGVVGRALEKNIFSCETINPRDFTTDVHKTIDDRPFGGGDGMVMLYEPLAKAVEAHSDVQTSRKIYLSPAGKKLDEGLVSKLANESHVTLLCGRYGGVDQRFLNKYNFENISVGDYVVSGGELPALTLMDAVVRKLPGVLGNKASAQEDSFAKGAFFEAPLYTRPNENLAGRVPAVLLSGDHKKIEEFRLYVGQGLTLQAREETRATLDILKLRTFLKAIPPEELRVLGFQEDFLSKEIGVHFAKN